MSKALHLMVTSLCGRNCKFCCNKQYDLNDIPYVTDKELDEVERVYLTGGEPFMFTIPNEIARKLKIDHPNIKRVVVYTNAFELESELLVRGIHTLSKIDGLSISIKNDIDRMSFKYYLSKHPAVLSLPYNRLYVFPGVEDIECPPQFEKINREWQEHFVPAENSIFRRI